MLKHIAAQVAFPLGLIFNISLNEGKIPDDWKRANVVPIHKSGDIGRIKNYRPISLSSVVGKLLERVVTRNIVDYMPRSGLISPQQHGFKSGRSCTTLLTKVCHHWMQILDNRSPPDVHVIFLDWSKAFDKVSHSIQLSVWHLWFTLELDFLVFIRSFPVCAIIEGLLPGGCLLSPVFHKGMFWVRFCSIFFFF